MTNSIPKAEIIKRPIEKVSDSIKKSAWVAAIESLIVLFSGIALIVWPDVTIQVVANVLGGIFIVLGIYQIINYFVMKGQEDFFNNGLLAGVLSLLIGIGTLVIGEDLAGIFRIIIGILLTYESLVRMNTAIKLHTVGISAWRYILAIACVMLALGLFITFNSGAVVQLIGWIMVATGAVGIIGDIMFIQHVNSVIEKLTKVSQ